MVPDVQKVEQYTGARNWYTQPFSSSLENRLSLYWSVSVGDYPHPRSYRYTGADGNSVPYPDSQSYVAILHQSIGSHNQPVRFLLLFFSD